MPAEPTQPGPPAAAAIPPETMPPELAPRYTLDGTIPVLQLYFNQGGSQRRPRLKLAKYEEAFAALRAGTFEYYQETGVWLQEALRDFSVRDARVAVFGSIRVNADAVALAAGAQHVYVLEYNVPISEHPQVEGILLEDALRQNLQVDAGISISTFEHDGLGRYGDPLDPDGDLRAMGEARRLLKPGGLLFLAVPVGQDCLVWNAHRVYGRIRLPKLLQGWELEGTYGFDEEHSYNVAPELYTQPVFVLRAWSQVQPTPTSWQQTN